MVDPVVQQSVPKQGELTWALTLVLASLSGAFGGILNVLRLLEPRDIFEGKPIPSGGRLLGAITLGGIIGSGGAIAMLFVSSAAGKLNTADNTSNMLTLISLGVISGFLGYRLLSGVADRLEKDVLQIQGKADAQDREIQQSKLQMEFVEAITQGLVAADNEKLGVSELTEPIRKLEAVRVKVPADRKIGIVLGRLYVRREEYDQAICVLSEVLAAKKAAGTGSDADAAALLYNRACYLAVLAGKTADPTKQTALKEKAYVDLESSVKFSPDNKKEAAVDDDFSALKSEDKFKTLIA